MVGLPVFNMPSEIAIQSYRGIYKANFITEAFDQMEKVANEKAYFIIDKNVSEIYADQLAPVLKKSKHIVIEANEYNKDLGCFSGYVGTLAALGVKRDCTLVAIGGGVIQDITCFLASTLFRGMNWYFYPTTLLAQADSCIGSKSSINVAGIKNLMGTFTPPNEIYIDVQFLKTLEFKDVISGVGEMIKVHGIAGISSLEEIAKDYEKITTTAESMREYIYKSLIIKKGIIEQDEFDTGIRNVMNYGHTFGHAVESATNYEISHGIAVTIGQDMACRYAYENKMISEDVYKLANTLLLKNFYKSTETKINFDLFLGAIKKDKKNIGSQIAIVIPTNDKFEIKKKLVEADESFINFCKNYFSITGFKLA